MHLQEVFNLSPPFVILQQTEPSTTAPMVEEPEAVTAAPSPAEQPARVSGSTEDGVRDSVAYAGVTAQQTDKAAAKGKKTRTVKASVAVLCSVLLIAAVVGGVILWRSKQKKRNSKNDTMQGVCTPHASKITIRMMYRLIPIVWYFQQDLPELYLIYVAGYSLWEGGLVFC